MRIFLQNPPLVQVGGQVTKSPYQLTLQGPDRNELYANADKLLKEDEQTAATSGCDQRHPTKNPQLNVDIDREKLQPWA
jgi:HAE1 family hydrophobic/amphiphilic exporter-1